MSWTKLSDDFADDCWTLSDEAFRLHVEGLCYSNRKLLDGRLTYDDVRRFAKHPEAVPELLAAGWWLEVEGQLDIQHHIMFQRTRDQVIKQQAANAANGARGGRPRKTNLTSASRANGGRKVSPSPATKTESLSEPVSEGVFEPVSPAPARSGESETFPQVKTESLSGSLSDSKTERDWTGLDRAGITQLREEQTHAREQRPGKLASPRDLGLPSPPKVGSAGAKVIGSRTVSRCECGNVADASDASGKCWKCAA